MKPLFLLNFLIACDDKYVPLQLWKLYASIQLAILKYSYLIFFVLSAIPCLFKSLGICIEGFWMRADFLNEARWLEGHPIYKISLFHVVFRA